MAELKSELMSPTVKKVLDEYIAVLHADGEINNDAADRLNALFRLGKVPKFNDIDAALSTLTKGEGDEP